MAAVRRVPHLIALVAAVVAGGPVRTSPPQTPLPTDALQRGVTLMETRGDCPGALTHFSAAVNASHPDTAARALLLSARCFERLGRHQEARAAYELVLSRHATHPVAAQARRRLQQLRPPAAPRALTWRQVEVDGADPNASLLRTGAICSRATNGET